MKQKYIHRHREQIFGCQEGGEWRRDALGVGISSVQFSCSVSDSLRPHESQHASPPCPLPPPRVYSNPCPSSW